MKKIQNSYKKSGVNISVANKFVDHIAKISKKNVKKTDKSFNADNIALSYTHLTLPTTPYV